MLQDAASSHKLCSSSSSGLRFVRLAPAPESFHQFITTCWCIKEPYITGNVLLVPLNATEMFDQMWLIFPLAEEQKRKKKKKKGKKK